MGGDRTPLGAVGLIVQVIWAAAGQVAQVVIGFVGLFIMVRLLGPEAYGVFAVALMAAAFADIIVGGHAAEFLVKHEDLEQGHMNAALALLLGAAAACSAAIFLAAPIVSSWFGFAGLTDLLRAAAALPILAALSTPPVQLLIRELKFERLALINALSGLTAVIVGVVTAYQGHGVWSLFWMETARRGVLIVLSYASSNWRFGWRFDARHASDVARFAVKRMENTGLRYVAETAVPRTIIGQMLGAEALGVYAVAHRLFEQISAVLNGPIAAVAFPAASRLQQARDGLADLVRNSIRLTTWVFWPALVGAIVVAPYLVPLALGADWSQAALVFSLLAVAGLRAPIASFNEAIFKAADQLRRITLLEGLSVVLGVALCSLGAHYYGLPGVAGAIALRQWVLWPVAASLVAGAAGVSPLRQLSVLVAAGAPTAVMAWALWSFGPFIASADRPVATTLALAGLGVSVYAAAWSVLNPDLVGVARRQIDMRLGRQPRSDAGKV